MVVWKKKENDKERPYGKLGGLDTSVVPPFTCCGPVSVAGERGPACKKLAMESKKRSSGAVIYSTRGERRVLMAREATTVSAA
jgi:hypothetical protein